MAREILFKAKRIDNGEWVEGLLWKKKYQSNKWFISCFPDKDDNEDVYVVDADTICQYTGLKDRNGRKIFENDVVFVTDDEGRSGQVDTGVGEIDFLEGLWYISGNVQNSLYDINKCFLIEVIGNIFDNTELLGGSDNG